MSRLAFPSLSTMMIDIVKAKGIDKRHGIDLEGVTFSAISGYYGALANGDADMTASGPLVVQKMILEGVPIRIGMTWARMNILSVITGDPSINSIEDLKGKTIAADMGSAEYQTLAVYGRSQNLVFGKDVAVVQASPPVARGQLEAKRVEAAMMWEPTTTLALRDHPEYRVILAGDTAWSAISKTAGWDLVVAVREDVPGLRMPTRCRGSSACFRKAASGTWPISTKQIRFCRIYQIAAGCFQSRRFFGAPRLRHQARVGTPNARRSGTCLRLP